MSRLAIWRLLRTVYKDVSGGVAVVTGLSAPVIAILVTGGTQYAVLVQQQGQLQAAADAAALGGAKNLQLGSAAVQNTQAVASTIAQSNLGTKPGAAQDSITALVIDNNTGVDVTIVRRANSVFGDMFGTSLTSVSVHAVAHGLGSPTPICILGLDGKKKGTISLDTNAIVQATTCAAYSNSRHPWSIASVANAVLKTGLTCAVGGKQGNFPNFSPQVKSGCPTLSDPLASRSAPSFGACDHQNLSITGSTSLQPGVYCGGLTISGGAIVTLLPGIYVIKDGPLSVSGGATIEGSYVGFYLTGSGAVVKFDYASTISLTAPKDGALAGLLFFEDRSNAGGALHQILSNNAQTLLGTIYLSQGRFYVGSNAPVAGNSAYTIVIADTVELSGGPTLVLNSNYGSSDIPVPDGVGNQSGKLYLTQ